MLIVNPLADPGGVASAHPPSPTNGTLFFCFRIRFNQKLSASEVGAPPPPPTGRRPSTRNPGSAPETAADTQVIKWNF